APRLPGLPSHYLALNLDRPAERSLFLQRRAPYAVYTIPIHADRRTARSARRQVSIFGRVLNHPACDLERIPVHQRIPALPPLHSERIPPLEPHLFPKNPAQPHTRKPSHWRTMGCPEGNPPSSPGACEGL